MIHKKFMLFQCCIPIKGINSGIIVDFQRKSVYKVPNQIIDILNEYKNKSIFDLFTDFRSNKTILKKYIRFFIDNELVIINENIDSFPIIETSYSKPNILEILTIEVVELMPYSEFFFTTALDQLDVKCLKLIIRGDVANNLEQILKYLEYSKIQSITLFIEHEKELELRLKKIKKQNPRLAGIIFYNFKKKIRKTKINFSYFDPLPLEKVLYKGIQNPNNFSLYLNLYSEALKYNVGFNKTIFIDHLGNIKKHYLDKVNYGNISDKFDFESILKNESIKEFWNATKDKTEICKDCEFRYVCTDNRIPFKKDGEKYYSHQQACNYDPFSSKWVS